MPNVDLSLDELRAYRGSSPRPQDFDAYWDRALAELDSLRARTGASFDASWSAADFHLPGFACRDLWFAGVRGARVHARVVIPERDGPVPAVMRFHGYTGSAGDWTQMLPLAAAGMAVFALDVRGQGGLSTDPGGTGINTQRGHIVRGLDDGPDDLFYRQVFLDTVALTRIAAADSRIDPDRLAATGASQGGALSLACAALAPEIRAVWTVYPFLCDYRRVWDMNTGEHAYSELQMWLKRRDPRHERIDDFFERLGYIDVQFLAERVRAHTVMVTGLDDAVCPPSSQFAAYNRLTAAASRRMELYPDFGHEPLPDAGDRALQFLLAHLKED